jgi:predicted PhzF superfamily epimerase YddE/YHI9
MCDQGNHPGALILSVHMPGKGYALRYFSPWHGKHEDSATGSAQSCLAPFWLRSGEHSKVCQLSPKGLAKMQVYMDNDNVWLTGKVHSHEG